MAYILSHWRGRQSLAWSFWVNLIALRIGILAIEGFTQPIHVVSLDISFWLTIAYCVFFHVFVLGWQVVGFLRACDQFVLDSDPVEWVWAAQAGMIISLVATVISVFGLLQSVLVDPSREIDADVLARERASKYTIDLMKGGRLVHLKGSFELGIARDLETFLKHYPGIKGIVLSSDGGRIYEGRGIADLAQRRELHTYVFRSCNSACTTAFIGGKVRILGANGKLGFHQYWHDAQLQHPFIDLQAEQDKDRQFYRSQNIKADFLSRIFEKTHVDLWHPNNKTLLDAGVVHKILTSPMPAKWTPD